MSKAKILVVEDEVIVAKNIALMLKKQGYIVSGTASSGKRAIQIATEKRPDIVLNGYQAKGRHGWSRNCQAHTRKF